MGANDFAPFRKLSTEFVVRNIANPPKVVRIFNYPILTDQTRDLLGIPGVGEADIRASLLKGEIQHKIRAHEIEVIASDIDLIQFNEEQKQFLRNAGVDFGIQVSSSQLSIIKHEDIKLVGAVDDVNNIFSIPSGKFIQDGLYKIIVYKNGVKQVFSDDYLIAESEGPGTGYDTIILITAPTTVPPPDDLITADYYMENI